MTALPEFNDYLVFADEAEGYSWLYCTDLGGRKNGRHSRESGNPRTRFHQRPLPRSGKTPQELIGSFYGVLMLRIKRPLKKVGAAGCRPSPVWRFFFRVLKLTQLGEFKT